MSGFIKEPSKRHIEIAKIANHLGANVNARDVKIVIEAIRIEHEERYRTDTCKTDITILCRDLKEASYA